MKKIKVIFTALAAVVGVSGAGYAQLSQNEVPYKRIGNTLHRITDYNPSNCDGNPTEACLYWLEEDMGPTIAFDTPGLDPEPDGGNLSYTGTWD